MNQPKTNPLTGVTSTQQNPANYRSASSMRNYVSNISRPDQVSTNLILSDCPCTPKCTNVVQKTPQPQISHGSSMHATISTQSDAVTEPRSIITSKITEGQPNKLKKQSSLLCCEKKQSIKQIHQNTISPRQFNIKTISAVDLEVFRADLVQAHNDFREVHGCRPLTLRAKLSTHAQEWADELATHDRMEHNPDHRYGENIYTCAGFEPTGFHVAESWYSEHLKYCFIKSAFSEETGHFTNMIWRETTQIGAGVARSPAGNFYVVASYCPSGNVRDGFERNVPPRRPRAQTPQEEMKSKSLMFGYRYNDFQNLCLDVHNEYRIKHQSATLKLDAHMCQEAQKWAETCAASNEIAYMNKSTYGQNIFCCKAAGDGRVGNVDGGRPVHAWYKELKNYAGKLNVETTHFTQLVWRTSHMLGVGVAKSRTGDVYIVAHYFPPGNITGQQEMNVRNWQKMKKFT